MAVGSPAPRSEQVAAFFQKHRTGLVTLVFTDLVDSTALLSQLGDQAGATFMQQRRQQIRNMLHALPEGEEIETAGDSFLLAFAKPSDAVRFALQAQARLRQFSSESGLPVQERIGIHLGEVVIAENETEAKAKDLYGIQLSTCARVMSLAEGGQILLTRGVFDSARQVLKGEDLAGVGPLSWVSHGPYLLKGIEEAVEVCEVREADQNARAAPKTSEKAQRQVRPDEEPVLGWRPAVGQLVPDTRWVLEAKLGEGGVGEVWVAKHQKLQERRVFKFCFRGERVRALKREVTLFGVLKERVGDHPHVVRLHDVYLEKPPYYLEEEYVEGKDLIQWCADHGGVGQVPLPSRLEIVAQVAEALQAAHDCGIIHRDVKPGNILISGKSLEPGEVTAKLSDFGVGQVTSAEVLAGVTRSGFTQTMLPSGSTQTGTLMYLAPELMAGLPATTRSDTYSLGVVLFQLLVGDFRHPLTADWSKQIDDGLLKADLDHCFAWKVEERFAGPAQLAGNLRALPRRQAELAQHEAEKAELERAAYRRGMVRTATVAMLIVVAVATLALYAFRSAREETRQRQRAEQQQRRAEMGEAATRQALYASDMSLARQAYEAGDYGQALDLLKLHRPSPGAADDRHWEWRNIWSLCRGDQITTLRTGGSEIMALKFLSEDRLLAGHTSGDLEIWDVPNRRMRDRSDENYLSDFAVSADNRVVAVAHWGQIVTVRTNGLHSPVFSLRHDGGIGKIEVSHDGSVLAMEGDRGLVLWDTQSRQIKRRLHTVDFWTDPGFSADDRFIAAPNSSGGLGIWDVLTGELIETPPLRGGSEQKYSPDGRWLAVGYDSGEIRIMDLLTKELRSVTNHSARVAAIAFSPDSKVMVSAAFSRELVIWKTAGWKPISVLHGPEKHIGALAFSPDGRTFASGSKDGTIRLWNTNSVPQSTSDSIRPAGLGSLSANGKYVATRETNGSISLLRASTLERVANIPAAANELVIGLSGGGRWAATRTPRVPGLRLWDLSGGATAPVHLDHEPASERFAGIAFAPDGRSFAVRETNSVLSVWTLPDRRQIARMPWSSRSFERQFRHLVYSPDGALIAVFDSEGIVNIIDTTSWRVRDYFDARVGDCRDVAIAPDNQVMALSGQDEGVHLWSLNRRKLIKILTGGPGGFNSVAFSPDGKRLAAGADSIVRVWELGQFRPVASIQLARESARDLAFAPDSDALLVLGDQIRILRAPPLAVIDAEDSREAEASFNAVAGSSETSSGTSGSGTISEWLMLGPIPVHGSESEALDREQLAGESSLRPREGERVRLAGVDVEWRKVRPAYSSAESPASPHTTALAQAIYLACYLVAARALTNGVMDVASDDAYRLFLNGALAMEYAPGRSEMPAARRIDAARKDRVSDVRLQAGTNVLIMKILTRAGDWLGSVTLADEDGRLLPGVRGTSVR